MTKIKLVLIFQDEFNRNKMEKVIQKMNYGARYLDSFDRTKVLVGVPKENTELNQEFLDSWFGLFDTELSKSLPSLYDVKFPKDVKSVPQNWQNSITEELGLF